MATAGMVNVGQLIREREHDTMLVGFGSYRGTVIAGGAWSAAMEEMPVPPAAQGSWEHVLHDAAPEDRLILLRGNPSGAYSQRRGHRAIGVVYHPDRERYGNYVPTILADRYDAFIYLNTTRALHPLHIEPQITTPPELYPWGV